MKHAWFLLLLFCVPCAAQTQAEKDQLLLDLDSIRARIAAWPIATDPTPDPDPPPPPPPPPPPDPDPQPDPDPPPPATHTLSTLYEYYVHPGLSRSWSVKPYLHRRVGSKIIDETAKAGNLSFDVMLDGTAIARGQFPNAVTIPALDDGAGHLVEIKILVSGIKIKTLGEAIGAAPGGIAYSPSRSNTYYAPEHVRRIGFNPQYSLASPGVPVPADGKMPRNTPRPSTVAYSPPSTDYAYSSNPANWITESIAAPRVPWYDTIPMLRKNSLGEIYVGYHFSKVNKTVDDSWQQVEKHPAWDGPRFDNLVTPYSTYVPLPDAQGLFSHRGWMAVGIDGRVWHLLEDGRVITVLGPRTPRDVIPDGDGGPKEMVGTSADGKYLRFPVDLCFDPTQTFVAYIADTGNNRIVKLTHPKGQAGHIEPHLSLDFAPFSLDMFGSEMAICDLRGHRVVIDGKSIFDPLIHEPTVCRYQSNGDLIVGMRFRKTIVRIKAGTHEVEQIAQLAGARDEQSWLWLDVDTHGTCFPKDSILTANSTAARHWMQLLGPDGVVQTDDWTAGRTDYTWAVAIHWDEARIVTSGYGDSQGVQTARPRLPTDPEPVAHAVARQYYNGRMELLAGPKLNVFGAYGFNFTGFGTLADIGELTASEAEAKFGTPLSADARLYLGVQ